MKNDERINDYIYNPFPLWNNEVVNVIIDYKWDTCLKNIFHDYADYSIIGCVHKKRTSEEKTLSLIETGNKIQIVFPSDSLIDFYHEHGLVTADLNIAFDQKINKINNAIGVLGEVNDLQSFIFRIVKSVQIIETVDAYTDISYSHPDIPFSIFFSVCENNSIISDLRVAESILHESMHLMLTLIEDHFDLRDNKSNETFYSPWRDEHRPLRGVLHGMFVFRAIYDFYTLLEKRINKDNVIEYLSKRKSEIIQDFIALADFPQSLGLTEKGRILSSRLLLF